MEHFLNNIAFLMHENAFLTYVIIYVGTILLGNLVSFSVLWLAFHGSFGPWGVPLMMGITVIADMSGDMTWYSMGKGLSGTKLGGWIEGHLPKHEIIMKYVERNAVKLIFLAKFIYSSTFPILFTVGWSNMDRKEFFKTSLKTIACWVPLMTVMCYALFSGFNVLQASSMFEHFEILFGFGLVAFIGLTYLISLIAKKYLGGEEL